MFDTILPALTKTTIALHRTVPVGISLLTILLLWRLWRFTVGPALWPDEPKPLPYWIPLIGDRQPDSDSQSTHADTERLHLGHSWEFMHHSQALFSRGHTSFPSGEPYALTIAGQKIVVIRNTQDVAILWKGTAEFTFDPFVQNVMKAFGLNHSAIELMFHDDPGQLLPLEARSSALLSTENPTSKCYFHMQTDWLRIQLHPGDPLIDLQEKYARFLTQSVGWDTLSGPFVISSSASEKLISLKSFTRHILGICAMKAFFGQELFDACPTFLSNYQRFEDASWKIFYNYSRILARSLHKVKDKVLNDLIRYFALPVKQRPDLAWIFQTMDMELANLGLNKHDRAGMMMMIIWASSLIFAQAICNPGLLADIRAETSKAISSDRSIDVDLLLSGCPQLDAVWYEALRLYNNAAVARKATMDTTICSKSLHASETILGPFRQFHTDSSIFGSDASNFDASRFLNSKNLYRTKGYHPFGGGNTYCPGRFFARSEIYIFVATALDGLDIQVAPGERLPDVDLETPSSSAMPPTKDVLVTVKPRASKH